MKTETTKYVLEAYLAVSPRHPHWTVVAVSAIKGWDRFRDDPRVSWNERSFVFKTAKDAIAVLKDIQKIPQEYYLRVSKVVTIVDHEVLAGADIEDGAIVDGPGDEKATARDPFWRTPQRTLDRIIPAAQVVDVVTREL